MEWGNFWSSHLPRTSYDIDLDAESPNPNGQGFEKIISGMYLGDIVRRVILRMLLESEMLGPISSKLSTPFILRTPLMAAMHEDDSPDLAEVAKILNDVFEVQAYVISPEEELRFWRVSQKLLRGIRRKWKKKNELQTIWRIRAFH